MSTLKVDTINTSDGTGNITVSRPLSGSGASLTNLPAANLTGTLPAISATNLTNIPAANITGTLPAISGASLTNLPAGGDTRNFILDGDFTQWPEGDKTSVANVSYTSALFKYVKSGGEIVVNSLQTADAPTVGESSHASKYCLHIDVTTAESAVAAGDFAKVQYHVTGSDFAFIHQQEITISFWHKHTKTGIYGCSLTNGAYDRSYVFEYTQTTTNTWEKVTKTITLDSSGTWLLTEAGVGLILAFTMFSGSTYHATADAWGAGDKLTTSNQVAGGDNAANNFKLSQVGLYLGSSAPNFLGEPISSIISQIAYYFQTSYPYSHGLYPGGAHMNGMVGDLSTGIPFNTAWYCIHSVSFQPMMRKSPTIVTYDRAGAAGKVTRYSSSGGGSANGIVPAIDSNGATGFRAYLGIGGSPVSYPIYGFHMGYTADARH